MHDAIVLEHVGLRLGDMNFHFNCAIAAGAITALTGPSGSGKSTLLNLVAGFEQPSSGRIYIAGDEHTRSHPSQRPVSIVFQDHNLFAHLDLVTNIGLGISRTMRLTAEERRRIDDALARVDLAGFGSRMPGSLSGGERQRAAFARALVQSRPILLLDEPFASLDADLRLEMAGLLTDLHRETNNTVVIVSHDREEIDRLGQRILHVRDGRLDSTDHSDAGQQADCSLHPVHM